jgi:hypothetical protein
MKFGFDMHGVIDSNPKLFSALTQALKGAGHEIHILTGPEVSTELMEQLYQWGIEWTHFFSIVGYHKELGTEMRIDEHGHAHMHPYHWDRTKGDYCKRMKIDVHFDDSDKYDIFFSTPYARFYNKDTARAKKMAL